MTKKLQSKGFDPSISSVEGQCANHYTMKQSVLVITLKWTIVYVTFAEISDLIDNTT